MTRPLYLADSGEADYLFAQCRELLYQIYWERGNAPLEFSALRLALEAHGVKATDPRSHWGILVASLKGGADPILVVAGRELAVAASRNQARNGAYALSPTAWGWACTLAEKRGWQRSVPDPEPIPEQVSLI
jgi:hypothetical protein